MAFADDPAVCAVSELCETTCAWPEPPQPAEHVPPLVWAWPAPCVVALPLEAWEPPVLLAD